MLATFKPLPDSLIDDRLGLCFCLALLLHALLILGVSFNQQDRGLAATKLEITLAHSRSQQAPEDADFLAQQHQQGSGTLDHKAMQTTTDRADFSDTRIHEVAPVRQTRQQQQQQASRQLLSSTAASEQQTAQRPLQNAREQQLADDQVTSLQRQREIASLEARLDIQRQAYAKRPRIRRLTSVSTRQADDARYLHNWRNRIEAIGNQNYPSQARQQQIVGDLRLMVSLLPNGEVHQVKILESSGHKVLDQAAIRIVHLAAPYDPFPQAMRSKVDILEIIRTWRFQNNRLTSNS